MIMEKATPNIEMETMNAGMVGIDRIARKENIT